MGRERCNTCFEFLSCSWAGLTLYTPVDSFSRFVLWQTRRAGDGRCASRLSLCFWCSLSPRARLDPMSCCRCPLQVRYRRRASVCNVFWLALLGLQGARWQKQKTLCRAAGVTCRFAIVAARACVQFLSACPVGLARSKLAKAKCIIGCGSAWPSLRGACLVPASVQVSVPIAFQRPCYLG